MSERRIVSLATGQARRLAQLHAFAQDLDEADDALQTAMAMDLDDVAQAKIRSHLITAGVIAYWRCFSSWKNKPSLEGRIKLSAESAATHEWARAWRNRVIAHSDSGMRRSLAFAHLTKHNDSVEVVEAFAMTLVVNMPVDRLVAFISVVTEVRAIVRHYQATQAWRTSHALSARAASLLWARPESLGVLGEPALMRWDPLAERVEHDIAVTVRNAESLDSLKTSRP